MDRRKTADIAEAAMVHLSHSLMALNLRAALIVWPEHDSGEGSMSSLVPAATKELAHLQAAGAIAMQLVFCCKHLGVDPATLVEQAKLWRPREEGN